MAGPLQGIVVLDLSRILAGPWATQVLADFGAEVLKVEHPRGGDDTRQWGPPYLRDAAGNETSESAYYLAANRGKRSLAIDFSLPEGRALVRQLAARADVFVENFKVGGLARHGLSYANLAADNPRLVYLSISAFGQDGPDAAKPGYDAMIQAMGGLMSLTGVPDGEPGAGPQKVGVAVADLMCGMYAVSAILAALHEREGSGQGQYIDLSLLDTQVAWLANQNLNYLVTGRAPQRQGTAHPNIVPYQAFATADGHLMLAVGNDAQFARFCAAVGAPELAADPRYATNADRVAQRAELVATVARLMRARSTQGWLEVLRAAEVPCGPINDLVRVFEEPQVRHRALRLDLPHPLAGTAPGVRNPVRFSRSALEYGRAPPPLGADTATELEARLGLDAAALAELAARGVIA
jgi:crotonobetainyl-CoA:carnitine CoA-transferase CaiB-like acyl-CoA transferase